MSVLVSIGDFSRMTHLSIKALDQVRAVLRAPDLETRTTVRSCASRR
jgi:hypothetical protein